MESLRWILLAVGVIFILMIYFFGRNRRRRNNFIENEPEDDLPEFTAQNLDDFDEGVGEVRVISDAGLTADSRESIYASIEDSHDDESYGNDLKEQAAEPDAQKEKKAPSNIIVLYILPKPERDLMGAQINSAAQAMGLTFGEMNIYHYNKGGRNIFSLANMLEPGSFNPETIHDLKTTGLTVFMQFAGADPLDDLTEMLQRSYQLSGLLDARLCNHKREPLTEQDAENYRVQASHFMKGETHRPTSKA